MVCIISRRTVQMAKCRTPCMGQSSCLFLPDMCLRCGTGLTKVPNIYKHIIYCNIVGVTWERKVMPKSWKSAMRYKYIYTLYIMPSVTDSITFQCNWRRPTLTLRWIQRETTRIAIKVVTVCVKLLITYKLIRLCAINKPKFISSVKDQN